jgi:hypothetical protein
VTEAILELMVLAASSSLVPKVQRLFSALLLGTCSAIAVSMQGFKASPMVDIVKLYEE